MNHTASQAPPCERVERYKADKTAFALDLTLGSLVFAAVAWAVYLPLDPAEHSRWSSLPWAVAGGLALGLTATALALALRNGRARGFLPVSVRWLGCAVASVGVASGVSSVQQFHLIRSERRAETICVPEEPEPPLPPPP